MIRTQPPQSGAVTLTLTDATTVDPTAVLFGLEDEFSVLGVDRIGPTKVKMIIEQTAREGPCPACGVLTSAVKDRPVMRLKDLPACGIGSELLKTVTRTGSGEVRKKHAQGSRASG